jgi:hypothetical protein
MLGDDGNELVTDLVLVLVLLLVLDLWNKIRGRG